MRVAAALAVVLALALTGAGCGGGGSSIHDDPHGTIDVKTGDVFTLAFTVNAGVGYEWQVIPFDFDPAKVKLLSNKAVYPDEKRAGASGQRRFRFRATTAGIQTLVFQHYFRGKPTDRRTLRIDVSPAK
jgi:predicted secreted protein